MVPALERFRPELIVIANGLDAGGFDPLGRMQLSAATFGELTRTMVGVAASLCAGRLVAAHEGGYSAIHVPFCGLAVIEALSGLDAGVDDPFGYLDGQAGQDLQAHQDTAVEAAARLVDGVPS